MNATVHERVDGNLVYITNDSGLPTLNQLFEAKLKELCPEIVAVDFIHGDQTGYQFGSNITERCDINQGGGIHCRTAERPDFKTWLA